MITFVAHVHMFDARQQLGLGWGGWDVITFLAGMFSFLALAHMFNAPQLLRFLLGCLCSLHSQCCVSLVPE